MRTQDSLKIIIQRRYHSSPVQYEHQTVLKIQFLQIIIRSTENSSPIPQHNVQITNNIADSLQIDHSLPIQCEQQALLKIFEVLVLLQLLLFCALREPRRDHEQEN